MSRLFIINQIFHNKFFIITDCVVYTVYDYKPNKTYNIDKKIKHLSDLDLISTIFYHAYDKDPVFSSFYLTMSLIHSI